MPARKHRPADVAADLHAPDATRPLWVRDGLDVHELVALLLSAARTQPVVVVSVHGGLTRAWIDVDRLAEHLSGLMPVYVVPAHLSRAMSDALPPLTQVYGGAGRVYPVGQAWTLDPYLSPLRLVRCAEEGPAVTDRLIEDGLALVGNRTTETTTAPSTTAGFVVGLVGASRAVVRLQDGTLASVWPELVAAGLTTGQLLQPGQPVIGQLEPASGRLDVTGSLIEPAVALHVYREGQVVLAQVRAVSQDTVLLAVHPRVTCVVPRRDITTNDRDDLREWFSTGDVVPARVRSLQGARVRLALDDIDDDEIPVTALAVLAGGPPWLAAPQPAGPIVVPAEVEPAPLAVVPDAAEREPLALAPATWPAVEPEAAAVDDDLPAVSAGSAQVRLEETISTLQQQVDWLTGERRRLLGQVAAQKAHLARKVKPTAKSERVQPANEDLGPYPVAFDDPLEQLRFEVGLEWATRIAPSQKKDLPLAPWTVGPGFLDSVAQVQGLSHHTLIRVIVEVLTGLAEHVPGRDLHRLRAGIGAGEPAVQRADGAICWRVALQKGASAARLHYWKCGEHIELSRVVVHAEMRP